ncbi:MAG: rhomboid family intramembrane serine protease [Candidatus Kapabacteria bacterium]|jgi:membrane associated rhomboid family serine protease|nr:rhomboid family intramembrane serine protease [Candidatus Kapabacteria bacterium]
MLFWQLLPTSHRVLLFLGVVYFVNVAMRGALTQWLALMPFSSVGGGQYWRFLTYPLASSSFWEMLSSSAILFFFAPEVERILSPRRMLLIIGVFVAVHGLVYAPVLWIANAPLAGTTAIALFVLTMYVYLYPTGEVSLFGLIPLRATMVLGIVFIAAVAGSVLSHSFNPTALINAFADAGFGIFFGFIFSHLYFGRFSGGEPFSSRRDSSSGYQASTRRASAPSPASVGRSSSYMSDAERRLAGIERRTDDDYDESTPLDEEHLNEILDKINEKGQASLTPQERKFLQDYANKL